MKRILFSVAVLIQYSSVVTTFRFEPMHAAPPISHGDTRISLGKRQDCPFGVVCGGGCAVLGPCCDEVTGFSCRDAETCTTINGQLGCCPVGTTCTTISSCLDATDPICVGGAPDNFFCCDTTTPFCNTLGTAQLCQATMSPRSSSSLPTSTAVTPSTGTVVQSSTASSNWTITTNTASSTTTTAISQNKTSAGTQQLIATIIFQSFRPLNTSRIATTPTSSPTTYASTTTSSTIITISPGTNTTRVTDSLARLSAASTSFKNTTSTSSSPTLRLEPTETTISVAPLFTGGSTVGCSANEFTIAAFGLLLAVFL